MTESVTLTREGQLIDGRGVPPDVRVDLDLRTITGPGDTMLERALEVLGKGAGGR
ncbi:MAG: hypothetical protein WDZ59_09115 [Pirellulales bacterium]